MHTHSKRKPISSNLQNMQRNTKEFGHIIFLNNGKLNTNYLQYNMDMKDC